MCEKKMFESMPMAWNKENVISYLEKLEESYRDLAEECELDREQFKGKAILLERISNTLKKDFIEK